MTAAIFGILLIGTPVADAVITRDAIYSQVSVATIALGGLENDAARLLLTERFKDFRKQPLEVRLGDLQGKLPLETIVALDTETALQQAMAVGHTGAWPRRLKERANARLSGITLPVPAIVDEAMLADTLQKIFFSAQTPPKDATFKIAFEKDGPRVAVDPEVAGSTLNIVAARTELEKRAAELRADPLRLEQNTNTAKVVAQDLEPLKGNVELLLRRAPIKIRGGDQEWIITMTELAEWVYGIKIDNAVTVSLDQNRIITWLNTSVKGIERSATDAVFELAPEENRVARFSSGVSGLFVPREENAARIAQAILETTKTSLELVVKETPPQITPNGSELYGIQELVGRGTTSFKGSPPNRVKNIKRGAVLLNGILIAPGEEFSLLDRLRPFTLKNGYLPELVIKAAESRTTPEIGGGLCQIGTTMFRAVLNAGLPITERRSHSYRVSYYEPPVGMDATIYDPAPDFKFINDTGNWLLLITEVTGTNLTFDLWGTKDGRTAISSPPEISNIRKPPEKKMIETLDLPPGKIKCTEKAHVGSDARFTYTVTYADGRVETKEFFSRYRPWQEICLVGVEKLAAEEVLPEPVPLSPDAAPPAPAQN